MKEQNEFAQRVLISTTVLCVICSAKGIRAKHSSDQCPFSSCLKCGGIGHTLNSCNVKTGNDLRAIVQRQNPDLPYIDNVGNLELNIPVAIDVESSTDTNGKKVAGRVAVVKYLPPLKRNTQDNIVFSCFIKPDNPSEINDCHEFKSGLNKDLLFLYGRDMTYVRNRLIEIVNNRKVVGIELNDDLDVLGINWFVTDTWDIRDNIKDINGQHLGLKQLAYTFYNHRIQEYSRNPLDIGKGHNPVIDAQVTMRIYQDVTEGKIGPKPYLKPDDFFPTPCYQWARDIINADIKKGLIPPNPRKKKRAKKLKQIEEPPLQRGRAYFNYQDLDIVIDDEDEPPILYLSDESEDDLLNFDFNLNK